MRTNCGIDFWFKEFWFEEPSPLGPPLRSDPQSYRALSDYLLTYSYSISGGNFQPLSMCSSCAGGGSALPLSTTRHTRCPSSISAPMLASLSAASSPRLPVCDRTCSILLFGSKSFQDKKYFPRVTICEADAVGISSPRSLHFCNKKLVNI